MTMEKLDKIVDKATEILKYIYVIHIILAFCALTNETWVTSLSPFLVLGLGAVVLLYRLVNFKSYLSYPFIWMYVFFVILYGITSIINIRYGFISNFKIIVWMTLQIGALYLSDAKENKENIFRELKNILWIIIILTTIINCIGITMLFTNYCVFRETSSGQIYLLGIAYWGRLYGVHTDPNYGAVQTVVAIMAAIFMILKSDKIFEKIGLMVVIVCNMFHLSFSGSRTGLVSLSVGLAIFSFIYILQRKRKMVISFVCAALAVVTVFAGSKFITTSYNYAVSIINEIMQNESVQDPDKMPSEDPNKKDPVFIGREEELAGDVSNRRFDLWRNSFEVFCTAPIMGISFGNIVSYCEENLPQSYLLTNDYVVFDAFHNMFMDLLASQGIVGTILFLIIILTSLYYLYKNRTYIAKENQIDCAFLFSVVVSMVVSSFFVSEILYVHNQVTVFFWIMWGILMHYYNVNLRGNERSKK